MRPEYEEMISVMTNTIGWEVYSDGREVRARSIEISDEEAERCRRAAIQIFSYLEGFRD